MDNRINVYLRVRPTTADEQAQIQRDIYGHIFTAPEKTPDPKKTVIVDSSGKQYNFDYVFRDKTNQKEIFEECALPSIQNLLDGYCGAVLAYGQTGTGKTHTMQGTKEDKGIIYRCADHLFQAIEKDSSHKYSVDLNFVQIYLDRLQDMFKPDAPEMTINPDTERVEIPGITSRSVKSADEFVEAYFQGNKHRVVRATNMNPVSSRGHAAFIVNLTCSPLTPDGTSTKLGKLVLVDLAGYERFSQTGVEGGIAMEEAKKINHSLLALGSVVNALATAAEKSASDKRKEHIPFRNSKLTRLLKDCLGGTSKTSIICAIGPLDKYKQETTGTLYFGFRAMAVKVNANVKSVFDPAKYTESLKMNLEAAEDTIYNMAKWWRRTGLKHYLAYVQANGVPTERDLGQEEVETPEELEVEEPHEESKVELVTTQIQSSTISDSNELKTVQGEVDNVRRGWNQELAFLRRQAKAEDMELRQRHATELQAMRDAGESEGRIRTLLEAQLQELHFAHATAIEQRQGIIAQAEEEEVNVLLEFASHLPEEIKVAGKAKQRVDYIIEFLRSTCHSKNDIVGNLIKLVVRREGEVSILEQEQILATERVMQFDEGTEKKITETQKENQFLMDEAMSLRMIIQDQTDEIKRLTKLNENCRIPSPVPSLQTQHMAHQQPHAMPMQNDAGYQQPQAMPMQNHAGYQQPQAMPIQEHRSTVSPPPHQKGYQRLTESPPPTTGHSSTPSFTCSGKGSYQPNH